MALADVLSGGEPLIDELIILALGVFWTAYLIKPFKLPKFLIFFLIFLVSAVLHNTISHILKIEETFFFIIVLLSLVISFALFLVFVFKSIKTRLFKRRLYGKFNHA